MRRGAMAPRIVGLVGALLGVAVAGCTSPRSPSAEPADDRVTLAIANDGAEALRCTILFGHWVEKGIGTIAAGDVAEVAMWRQRSDGALYAPRSDGRRMMIENMVCGPLSGW